MASVAPQVGGRVSVGRRWVAVGSGLLWVGVTGCYAVRPDLAAAVTLFPAWLWVLPGLLLALVARPGRRGTQLLLGLWLLFFGLFAEEAWSLLRSGSLPSERRTDDGSFRVVSLNCAGGSPEAANEVAAWKPDLVLLQEVPARGDVVRLARRLYGAQAETVYGYDTAVLARGDLSATVPARAHSFFVAAQMDWRDQPIEVVSLRLTPPVVRLDLWSLGCWTEQTANRKAVRYLFRVLILAGVVLTIGHLERSHRLSRDLGMAVRAIGTPDEGIARLLLEAGADPNIREPACLRTPLMFAATTENARLVGLLIARGAEVNAVGLNDDYALERYGLREVEGFVGPLVNKAASGRGPVSIMFLRDHG